MQSVSTLCAAFSAMAEEFKVLDIRGPRGGLDKDTALSLAAPVLKSVLWLLRSSALCASCLRLCVSLCVLCVCFMCVLCNCYVLCV